MGIPGLYCRGGNSIGLEAERKGACDFLATGGPRAYSQRKQTLVQRSGCFMRGAAHFGLGSLLGLLLVPVSGTAGGIPPKTLKELKAASVYIKVEFTAADGKGKTVPVTGSGFLVHVADGAGFIATNNHVVMPLAGEVQAGNPKVVFHSGTPNERIVDAHIVARDAVRDLAVLKVATFKDMPRAIPMDPSIEVGETMPVYAIGFPFGKDLALGRSNPAITITRGTISSLRYDNRGDVKLVQIDAEINPGNSGGPVVDDKGRLLGVAVSKHVQARTVGFAIPLKPLAEMMQGKVATVVFDTLWVVKGQAEVGVEAGLTDPLGKLKDAALYYRVAGDVKKLPRPDNDGKVPLLKDANQLWLKMSPGRGQGRFTLKSGGADKVTIAYQASYVTAAGATVVSPLSLAVIDFTQVVYSDRLTRNDALDAKANPRKVYAHPMKAGRHYVVDMRGDPKDLDPRLIVQDAAGQPLAEDDGSGGLFDALLIFSPPKDGDYQIVTTATKGMGPFTLRIREDSGQALGPKGLTLSGALASDDFADGAGTPQQAFNLHFRKGKSYVIDVKSREFDPFLRLENMAKVVLKNEDIGGGGHSTLFFSPFQDGIYRLTTTAYDSKLGRFDLTVRETAGPKQHDIGQGLKLPGNLNAFDPLDIVNGKQSALRCKIFAVSMKAGRKYQIDMTSMQFDPFLRIEDERGRQLAADDDSGGNLNARLTFTPPTDGVYRIIATQFDTRFGAFDLFVRPVP